jgi:pre-rRNA-processing protein TSR2
VTHNWKPAQTTNDPEYPPENAGQKRTRLAEELVDAYYSTYTSDNTKGKTPDSEEIEDFLLDFFEFEYGVKLEDMSEVQVRKDTEDLWKECIAKASGQSTSQVLLEKFERMADKARNDDADPAKAFRGTRTGDQDDEDDDEDYTTDEEDGEDAAQADGMEVDGQLRTAASHPQREEPQVDEDGFTTVTKGKKGRH